MYAAIDTAIVERLTAKLDSSIKVKSAPTFERAWEQRNMAPVVFSIWQGFSPADVNTNVPHIQQIEQTWALLVITKNAKGGGDSLAAREDASAISILVLESMLGYMVAPGVRLKLAGSPGVEDEGGFAYLPIGVSCRSTFKGDPG